MRTIAVGGFGAVMQAEQRNLGRPVAVKVLLAELVQNAAQTVRFAQEARLTASISHPNVVKVLDYGSATGVPWIVYEFIPGQNLRSRIEAGTLDPGEAVQAASQVADALHQAHAKGILHRDIKPENVLIGEDGRYKVADFGIAKWTDQGGDLTETGLLLGTPAYLAPEILSGARATTSSDIYSLGIMLFEMVTGELPYGGTNPAQVVAQHLHAPIPSAVARVPSISHELDVIIARAMAKTPDKRYPTILAMRDALAALSGEPGSSAGPGSPGQRTVRMENRHAPRLTQLGPRGVPDPKGRRVWILVTALLGLAAVILHNRHQVVRPLPVAVPRASPQRLSLQAAADALIEAAGCEGYLETHDAGANTAIPRSLRRLKEAWTAVERKAVRLGNADRDFAQLHDLWRCCFYRFLLELAYRQIERRWPKRLPTEQLEIAPSLQDAFGRLVPLSVRLVREALKNPTNSTAGLAELFVMVIQSNAQPLPSRWREVLAVPFLSILKQVALIDPPRGPALASLLRSLADLAETQAQGRATDRSVLGPFAGVIDRAADALEQFHATVRMPAQAFGPVMRMVGSAMETTDARWRDHFAELNSSVAHLSDARRIRPDLQELALVAIRQRTMSRRWNSISAGFSCPAVSDPSDFQIGRATILVHLGIAFTHYGQARRLQSILELPINSGGQPDIALPEFSSPEGLLPYFDFIRERLSLACIPSFTIPVLFQLGRQLVFIGRQTSSWANVIQADKILDSRPLFRDLALSPSPLVVQVGQLLYSQLARGRGGESPLLMQRESLDLELVARTLNWQRPELQKTLRPMQIPVAGPPEHIPPDEVLDVMTTSAMDPAVAAKADPALANPDAAAKVQHFLEGLYPAVLGRALDADGRKYWTPVVAVHSPGRITELLGACMEARLHRARTELARLGTGKPDQAQVELLAQEMDRLTLDQTMAKYLAGDAFYAACGGKEPPYRHILAAALAPPAQLQAMDDALNRALYTGGSRIQVTLSLVRSPSAIRRHLDDEARRCGVTLTASRRAALERLLLAGVSLNYVIGEMLAYP